MKGEKNMNSKMNMNARAKAVLAMEYLARCVNDEDNFDLWLSLGVADGDIEDGCLEITENNREDLEFYVKDNDRFRDLMTTFLKVMKEAWKDGGLYCDGVVSKDLRDYR